MLSKISLSLPTQGKATNKFAALTQEIMTELHVPYSKPDFESILHGAVLYKNGIGPDKAYAALQETKRRGKGIEYFWGIINQIKEK